MIIKHDYKNSNYYQYHYINQGQFISTVITVNELRRYQRIIINLLKIQTK